MRGGGASDAKPDTPATAVAAALPVSGLVKPRGTAMATDAEAEDDADAGELAPTLTLDAALALALVLALVLVDADLRVAQSCGKRCA